MSLPLGPHIAVIGTGASGKSEFAMLLAVDHLPTQMQITGSGVFGGAENLVHIVTSSAVEAWPRMSKAEVARKLIARIAADVGSAR